VVHGDVKPTNFIIPKSPTGKVEMFAIDFGLSVKVRNQLKKRKYYSGNAMFGSVNTLRGAYPAKRDDIESLAYVLIWLLSNRPFPWRRHVCKLDILKVADAKTRFTPNRFCARVPDIIVDLLNHSRALDATQTPNYDFYFQGMMAVSVSEEECQD